MKSPCWHMLFAGVVFPLAAQAQMSAPAADPGSIVVRFVKGGTRGDFLQELRAAVASHSDTYYEREFPGLITALERESEPPAGYEKAADKRSGEESIHAWIYDLRNVGAAGEERGTRDPVSQLTAAGPAALAALVMALDDDTPSRQLGFEAGPSLSIVLRRSDLALTCIERISGVTFFRRTQGRGGYFHNDAQRASVKENVRAWWTQSQGKSEAEGIRAQLGLWEKNTTLAGNAFYEADLLFTLAQLESPAAVIGRLRVLCAADTYGLNSPISEGMLRVDPQFLLREVFNRLAANKVRGGDYFLLLKYGDRKIYQALGQRAEVDHQLDPGSWTGGEQAEMAAAIGKNWGIPIVAAVLARTEMTGSRSMGASAQRFCWADEAAVCFQELTGKDFGYHKEDAEADRLAAIGRARAWWVGEGHTALAEKIAADHACATDGTDLLATDETIDAVVKVIGGGEDGAARAAIAGLGKVYSYRVEEALVARLAVESDAAQRVVILGKLDKPALWQAPALAAVFEKDASLEVRVAAGAALLASADVDGAVFWFRRFETRDGAMVAVRRVAKNPPPELVLPALRLLMRHHSAEDAGLIRALAAREPARSDAEAQEYVETLDRAATMPN